ncbi:IS3 family transposase [Paraburkholderia sp. SIMBA_027]|uniref:IS3 family transposase n=1 Tax=Paraburkholderia sp. SIMBA_027 TaxID=3085770 RepID=UPI00397E4648
MALSIESADTTAPRSASTRRRPSEAFLSRHEVALGNGRARVHTAPAAQLATCPGKRGKATPMESFFKTLKVGRIYQVHYETRAEARLDIVDWIEGYYNRERLHTSIGFLTPVDYEAALIAA